MEDVFFDAVCCEVLATLLECSTLVADSGKTLTHL